MGVPVTTFMEFESHVKHSTKAYTMIIFANAESDSNAVEYVLRNFHIMDVLSDDVDFYMPGYQLSDIRYRENIPVHVEDYENEALQATYADYHDSEAFAGGILGITHNNRQFIKVIDSPRLGPIRFNEAAYADFVMELGRKCPNYVYMGTCQLNLIPIVNGVPDYLHLKSYDLDAIVECQSGPSLDAFFHNIIHLIRSAKNTERSIFSILTRRHEPDIVLQIDKIYEEATRVINHNRYEITIHNVIVDMERVLRWSLTEEYFFISYSSRNVMKAMMLGRMMHDRKLRVWIAPDGIPQGREYSLVVPTALRLAKNFVLLLTPDSAKSNWVKRELDIAISNEANTRVKVLLADGFTIDDIRRDNELMFYLNRVQVKYEYDDVISSEDVFRSFILE